LICFAWIAAATSAAFDIKFAVMGIMDPANFETFTPDGLEYSLMVRNPTENLL
jgi:hypothetical protein